jgi:uncharacterized OB-fold protein
VTQQTQTAIPTPAPVVNQDSQTFWDATAQGKLLLPKCDKCQTIVWYPRHFCPECSSFDVSWIEASGKGTIYSFTVNRRGQGDYRDMAYVLAYVQLAEGPRMLTNIVDCDYEKVAIGQPVELVFQDTGKGTALPRFRPST